MTTEKPSLDDLLGRADLHAAAAGRIASALAGAVAAEATPTEAPAPDAATADAFASAIVDRLGFASAAGHADVRGALAARAASALSGMPEFVSQPAVASVLGAVVASTLVARIEASPALASILNSRLSEITGASQPAATLSRRKSVDD